MSLEGLKVEEKYVETISAVNYLNGVVRLYCAGHDVQGLLISEDNAQGPSETRFCVTMPLSGFLYAMSVVNGFVENERFAEIVKRSIDAGLIPTTDDA